MRVCDADAGDLIFREEIPRALFESCRKAGLEVSAVAGEDLVSVVPKGAVTTELAEAIADHKPWFMAWLRKEGLETNRAGRRVWRIQ